MAQVTFPTEFGDRWIVVNAANEAEKLMLNQAGLASINPDACNDGGLCFVFRDRVKVRKQLNAAITAGLDMGTVAWFNTPARVVA